MAYRVTVWGARGSIPTPGPATARYGGNTSCVSVELDGADGDRLVILDAGTGIRPLGKALAERAGDGGVNADLLVTHTHWDHIQGLPFFAPGRANAVRIWGPRAGEVPLEQILRYQMNPVVFPVPLDQLAAELTVRHVDPDPFEVDGFSVRAVRMRHPAVTLGYRLTPKEGGESLAYLPDNELGLGGEYDVGPKWRDDVVAFLAGTQVLIHDAMYTPDELDHHRGWGHSSHMEAVALAVEAGVRTLVLFHHRPEHDDVEMDRLLEEARGAAARHPGGLQVVAATEGQELTL